MTYSEAASVGIHHGVFDRVPSIMVQCHQTYGSGGTTQRVFLFEDLKSLYHLMGKLDKFTAFFKDGLKSSAVVPTRFESKLCMTQVVPKIPYIGTFFNCLVCCRGQASLWPLKQGFSLLDVEKS